MLRYYIILVMTALCVSCSGRSDSGTPTTDSVPAPSADTTPAVATVAFNTDTAMYYLRRQVEFGPRVPGSAAHRACADWMAGKLRDMGAAVTDNTVTDRHPVTGQPVAIRNIFAQFNPDKPDRVLVLAHYDTRPWADNDPDAANHTTPIDGANDGASGVAVAMELARLAAQNPPAVGLDILLVDQEDSGSTGDDISWCLGSRYWANNRPAGYMPRYAILLDMVGGRDAHFGREYFGERYVPWLNTKVWNAAASIGLADRFPDEVTGAINDDHLSLLQVGIPTIDIIEVGNPRTGSFNPTWHTLDDNLDNIDPATVRAVGRVMTKVIYDEK